MKRFGAQHGGTLTLKVVEGNNLVLPPNEVKSTVMSMFVPFLKASSPRGRNWGKAFSSPPSQYVFISATLERLEGGSPSNYSSVPRRDLSANGIVETVRTSARVIASDDISSCATWNEDFSFDDVGSDMTLRITCLNKSAERGNANDEFLVGEVLVPIVRLPDRTSVEQWYQLQPPSNSTLSFIKTAVRLRLMFSRKLTDEQKAMGSHRDSVDSVTSSLVEAQSLSRRSSHSSLIFENGPIAMQRSRRASLLRTSFVPLTEADLIVSDESMADFNLDNLSASAPCTPSQRNIAAFAQTPDTYPNTFENLAQVEEANISYSADEIVQLAREVLPSGLVDYFLVVGPLLDSDGQLKEQDTAQCGFGTGAHVFGSQGFGTPLTSIELLPGVLEVYPRQERADVPYTSRVEWFCFPEGARLIASLRRPNPRISSFVRFIDGCRSYGLCLTFFTRATMLTTEYAGIENEQQHSGADAGAGGQLPPLQPSPASPASPQGHFSPKFWTPVCLCLLTHIPIIEQLVPWLKSFYHYMDREEKGTLEVYSIPLTARTPLFQAISQISDELPVPIPGVCAMSLRAFNNPSPYLFSLSGEDDFPTLSFGLSRFIETLGPQGVVNLVGAALQEARILLHSKRVSLLPIVAEGVFALMYPLQWPYAYVPVLPRVLVELVESPQPFILGIHTDWLSELNPDSFTDLVVVDCDTGTVDTSNAKLIPFPSDIAKFLRTAVRRALDTPLGQHARLPDTPSRFNFGSSSWSINAGHSDRNLRVQFARAMVDMMFCYTDCLFFMSADRPIFNGPRFLDEYCRESHVKFVTQLIETLAFNFLLENQDSPMLYPFSKLLDRARRQAFRNGNLTRRRRSKCPTLIDEVIEGMLLGNEAPANEQVNMVLPPLPGDSLGSTSPFEVQAASRFGLLSPKKEERLSGMTNKVFSSPSTAVSPRRHTFGGANLISKRVSYMAKSPIGVFRTPSLALVRRTNTLPNIYPSSAFGRPGRKATAVFDDRQMLQNALQRRKSSLETFNNAVGPLPSPTTTVTSRTHAGSVASSGADKSVFGLWDGTVGEFSEAALAVPLHRISWAWNPILLSEREAPSIDTRSFTLAEVGELTGVDLVELVRKQAFAVQTASGKRGHDTASKGWYLSLLEPILGGIKEVPESPERESQEDSELNEAEEHLYACMEAVFSSNRVVEDSIHQAEELLRNEKSAQKKYLQVLSQDGRRGAACRGPFLLHGPSFEALARFSYTLLSACIDNADYDTAHALLQLTGAYFQIHEESSGVVVGASNNADGGQYFTEFLSGRIRRHPIFASVQFWIHILSQRVNPQMLAMSSEFSVPDQKPLLQKKSGPKLISPKINVIAGTAKFDRGLSELLVDDHIDGSSVSSANSYSDYEEGRSSGAPKEGFSAREGVIIENVEKNETVELVCREARALMYDMVAIGITEYTAKNFIKAVQKAYGLPADYAAQLQEQAWQIWDGSSSNPILEAPGRSPMGKNSSPSLRRTPQISPFSPAGKSEENAHIPIQKTIPSPRKKSSAETDLILGELMQLHTVSPRHQSLSPGKRGSLTTSATPLSLRKNSSCTPPVSPPLSENILQTRNPDYGSLSSLDVSKMFPFDSYSPNGEALGGIKEEDREFLLGNEGRVTGINEGGEDIVCTWANCSPALCLALDLGGTTVVSGNEDGSIMVHNVEKGDYLGTISDHEGPISCLIVQEDLIISGSLDSTVRISRYPRQEIGWNPNFSNSNYNKVLNGHSRGVLCMEVMQLNEGLGLIAGSGNGEIRLWDLDSFTCLRCTEEAHESGISCICLDTLYSSKELNSTVHALTGSQEGGMKLWEIGNSGIRGLRKFSGHDGNVSELLFTGPNSALSASFDHSLRLWDKRVRGSVGILKGHQGAINCMKLIPMNNSQYSVASCSDDCTVRIWDPRTASRRTLFTLTGHKGAVTSLHYSGVSLYSGSNDGRMMEWDCENGELLCTYAGHAGSINKLGGTMNTVVSASSDGTLRIRTKKDNFSNK